VFAKENLIILFLFAIIFIVTWPYNISARKRAKKEADEKKASTEGNQ